MRHKGPVWIIIFFLIIAFVLINTLETPSGYLHPVKIEATSEGFTTDTTITSTSARIETDEAVYQQFHLKIPKGPNEAKIAVEESWLQQEEVAPQTLKIYRKGTTGWEEQPRGEATRFSKETTIAMENLTSGDYYIAGTPGSAPKEKKGISAKAQLAILAGLITLLLFIAYHRDTSNEASKHERKRPGQEELDTYIKASLLAGHEEKDIKERLIKAGWDEERVHQGLRRARFL